MNDLQGDDEGTTEDNQDQEYMGALIRGIESMMAENPGLFDVIATAFSSTKLDDKIVQYTRESKYTELKQSLTRENASLMIENSSFAMTGMELATHTIDYKMLLIFFWAGADPEKRVFDGYMQTHASFHGAEDPITFPSVRAVYDQEQQEEDYEGETTTGFEFLKLIYQDSMGDSGGEPNGDAQKLVASLWLLDKLHKGQVALDEDTVRLARDHIHLIHPSFDWDTEYVAKRKELEDSLVQLEASHTELPGAVVQHVAGFAQPMKDHLLRTIRAALEEAVDMIETEEEETE